MKKIIALLVLLLAMPLVAEAGVNWDDVSGIKDEVNWKQGVAYSLEDSKWNYVSTIEVAKKYGLALEAGYMGDADKTDHKAVAVISGNLIELKDYVDLPILNLIEANIGLYAGYGRITLEQLSKEDGKNNEFDWGISLTLIDLKF